jgi:chloramphenicol-sensitive protein RarD
MQQKKGYHLLAAISAALIWSFLTIPLRSLHAHGYDAEQILYYRVFVSLVIVWVINLTARKRKLKQDIGFLKALSKQERNKILILIFCTGLLITGNWFSYIYVANNVSIKAAAFAYMICPLFTAALGYLVFKERLSALQTLALGLALLSIIFLSTGSLEQVIYSSAVALTYTGYLLMQRLLTKFDKLTLLGVQLIISVVFLGPFFLVHFKPIPADLLFWGNIFFVAAIFTVLPLALTIYSVSGLPSSTLGVIIYINPIFTFVVAYFYFDEKFDMHQISGYLMLLAAVIIFNYRLIADTFSKKKKPVHQLI